MGTQLDMFGVVLPSLPSKEHLKRLYEEWHLLSMRSPAHVKRIPYEEATRRTMYAKAARTDYDVALAKHPRKEAERLNAEIVAAHPCNGSFVCEHAIAAQAEVDAAATAKDDIQ